MSVQTVASTPAASGGSVSAPATTDAEAHAPPPYTVVSQNVTPIMPLGYTQTQTVKADGVVTTVITDPAGGTVDTIYGTLTMQTSGSEISLWA